MGASTVNCYITKQEVVNNRLSASLSLSSRRFILSWVFFLFALRFSLKFFPWQKHTNECKKPASRQQATSAKTTNGDEAQRTMLPDPGLHSYQVAMLAVAL